MSGHLAESVRIVFDVVLVEFRIIAEVRIQIVAVVHQQVDRVLRLPLVPHLAVVQLIDEHVDSELEFDSVDKLRMFVQNLHSRLLARVVVPAGGKRLCQVFPEHLAKPQTSRKLDNVLFCNYINPCLVNPLHLIHSLSLPLT